MFELQNTPLDVLINRCKNGLQARDTDEGPLRELIRRAVQDQNDAAWDSLVALLRPRILDLLYNSASDVAPSNAESLVYHTLNRFRQRVEDSHLAAPAPSHQSTLGLLLRCVDGVLAEQG